MRFSMNRSFAFFALLALSFATDALCGILTDSRDGQTYRTVKIGNQEWMAENLNYETANSYCYEDEASNCTKYGRLYATWAAAMDSVGTWSTNGRGCGYVRHAHQPGLCAVSVPRDGICRQKPSLRLCSLPLVVNQQRAKCSSPLAAGTVAATAPMLSVFPRCPSASGTTWAIITTKAASRASGVLRRAIAAARTAWA